MTARAHLLFPLAIAGLLVAAGCGGSSPKAPTTPDAPSVLPSATPSPAPAPSPSSGATVAGFVSHDSSGMMPASTAGIAGVNVTVAGTSLHSTTDGSGHFMLTNVPAGSVRLQLSGAGLSGEVQIQDVADQDTIEVDIESQGGALEVQNEEHDHGSESELEGKVTSVNLGAQSFVVGQTTVLASGASITDGFRALAFTDIVVGARVHVRGSKSGSTLTAMQIEVQQSTLDKVEDSGPATDLGSACPDLTFKIGSQAIAVNASTIFVKGTCGDIVSGVIVDVKGLKRTDGSILATQLKFESDHAGGGDSGGTGDNGGDSADVELTGTVSGLGGGCPAITFLAGGRTVMTTGATTFDTPCATIANGLKVQVNGKAASGNGPVAATRVKVQD